MTANKPTEKKRILVVDDERHVVDYFRRVLESAGYQVDVAYDGKEAFRKTNREHYDLVHMDIKMPNWDGVDAIVSMEHLDTQTNILVVSGFLTEDVLSEIEDMPLVKGWMNKPVSGEDYLRTIRAIVG